MPTDGEYMKLALGLARRGYGFTSPNPMVGALLVKRGRVVGRGFHRKAGLPHAEIEAIEDAVAHGENIRGASLYVTLEPCCTTGRTPPCTEAIIRAGIRKVVVGATDPNPRHAGKGFDILRKAGVRVNPGVLEDQCFSLNMAFNHWIARRMPFVTVKAAMTLDGKIATRDGESKWITGEKARDYGMHLRQGSDAILVGINTVLADDPALTVRGRAVGNQPRRIVLDPKARTPPDAKLITDEYATRTLLVVGDEAPERRVRQLEKRVAVLKARASKSRLDLRWMLRRLGEENVVSLLVEGGGEANASFLLAGLANRIVFFYAPKVLGGKDARRGVAGEGAGTFAAAPVLERLRWRKIGTDLLLDACVREKKSGAA